MAVRVFQVVMPTPGHLGLKFTGRAGEHDGLFVQSVAESSPCDGLIFPGDRIVQIDDLHLISADITDDAALAIVKRVLAARPYSVTISVFRADWVEADDPYERDREERGIHNEDPDRMALVVDSMDLCADIGRRHLDSLLEQRIEQSYASPGAPWRLALAATPERKHGEHGVRARDSEADSGYTASPATPPSPKAARAQSLAGLPDARRLVRKQLFPGKRATAPGHGEDAMADFESDTQQLFADLALFTSQRASIESILAHTEWRDTALDI